MVKMGSVDIADHLLQVEAELGADHIHLVVDQAGVISDHGLCGLDNLVE